MKKKPLQKPETYFQKWMRKYMNEKGLSMNNIADSLHVTRQCILRQYNDSRSTYVFILGYCKVFGLNNPDAEFEVIVEHEGWTKY